MTDDEPQTALIDDVKRARLALSPIRKRLLVALRKPSSATTLAAELGLPRQRIGYHLRALEEAGLIELVEERPRRGFVERVLLARADAFVVDPSILGAPPKTATQDRFAADHLVSVAAGIVRDVSRMRQAADEAGQRLLTFTIEADIGFSTPRQLEDFASEVTEAVAHLARKYPRDGSGRRYRLVVGAHPAVAGKKKPTQAVITMNDPNANVLVEVTISAPIDTVWNALREPEQIAQWFGWESETLDDEIALIFGRPVIVDEGEHRLKFGEWEGIADGFELVEHDGKTRVRVVRFAPVPDSWDDVYSDVREGWVTFVHQLRFWIERHHGQQRRTIYLSAPAPRDDQPLSGALGLETLWDAPPDTPCTVELPTESLEVNAWHRTGFQLGLHVPAWGDGMLVVMDMPADAKRPARSSLLITTFGMNDGAASEFNHRWKAWWESRHAPARA